MQYKQVMPISSASDRSTSKRQRNMRIGQSIAASAVAYPFLVYATVWSHYALLHSDLSERTGAFLLLLALPICLGCVFSIVIFIADGSGKRRVAGIVGALIGIIVNLLLILANSTV